MAATHPLAIAASRAHPQDDAVLAAQHQGEAIDARIEHLSVLTEGNAGARAELIAAARELGRVAGEQESGATPGYWRWVRSQVGTIRAHAVRLGFDPEALDIRGPSWTAR